MALSQPEGETLLGCGEPDTLTPIAPTNERVLEEAPKDDAPPLQTDVHTRRTRAAAMLAVGLLAAALVAIASSSAVGWSRRPQAASGDGAAELEFFAEKKCTIGRANCNATKCCEAPGMQCYEQGPGYSQCRVSCIPGPDPTHWDGNHWSCKPQGPRTAGADWCGKPGQDCRTSKCCQDPGLTCWEKNSSFASCKAECVPGGPDLIDMDSTPWTCRKLGEPAPSTAPWVASKCAGGWDNCVSKACCKNAGEQCYLQNDYFGECKAKQACGAAGWSCKTRGSATPTRPIKGGKLAPWVLKKCSKPNEGCLESKCCLGMDQQCYEKAKGWAQCKQSCKRGKDPNDNNDFWSCKELGPRSYGLAIKGFPSLYCFSVLRTVGYEPGLMTAQFWKKLGIFACDDYSLLTADATTKVGTVHTIKFQGAPIVNSIDNTAGNTELFVHAWNTIIGQNKWRDHSFTVKVDPDAVFFADRLRWHVLPHVGEKMFVINCDKGDMIYGALEVFSFAAIQLWALKGTDCPAPNNYGEDKYMTTCMDHLGVPRVHDESELGDNLCSGADCSNGWTAAFHPFKDEGMWMNCWKTSSKMITTK